MRTRAASVPFVILLLISSCFGQSSPPRPALSDVVLRFETDGNRNQFHLGEFIPVKWSYTAQSADTYIWVSQSEKLAGGRPFDIACSAPAERINSYPATPDGITLQRILIATCGGGVAFAVGGGCADCDSESPLEARPIGFGARALNSYFRFPSPGTYTCQASSTDNTTAPHEDEIRPALLVKSNPLVLTIADDPAWSHSAAVAYGSAYERVCRNDHDADQRRLSECSDISQRITYLNTSESLALEVREFDGRKPGWNGGFWEAIQHAPQPKEALRLMTARMQDRDFQVMTERIIEWLAISDLKLHAPDAFRGGDPAAYHTQAVATLRKYVRLLGRSLSRKSESALPESMKAYRGYAEQKYCGESLIPSGERSATLKYFH